MCCFFSENEGREVILLGDTNCNLYVEDNATYAKRIKDLYAAYDLKQLINEPTMLHSYIHLR